MYKCILIYFTQCAAPVICTADQNNPAYGVTLHVSVMTTRWGLLFISFCSRANQSDLFLSHDLKNSNLNSYLNGDYTRLFTFSARRL